MRGKTEIYICWETFSPIKSHVLFMRNFDIEQGSERPSICHQVFLRFQCGHFTCEEGLFAIAPRNPLVLHVTFLLLTEVLLLRSARPSRIASNSCKQSTNIYIKVWKYCRNISEMLAIWDIQPGGGQNGHLLLPRKWVQEPKFSRKPAVSNLLPIDSILAMAVVFRYDIHTAQEPGSLFGCHAAASLRFTHVRTFACRGRFWN